MNKSDVNEAKQEAKEIADANRALRKHLKGMSKNQLINTVMELASSVMQSAEINQGLNNALEILKNERKENEKVTDSASSTTA
jgi:hypothetical protein